MIGIVARLADLAMLSVAFLSSEVVTRIIALAPVGIPLNLGAGAVDDDEGTDGVPGSAICERLLKDDKAQCS